MKWLITVFFLLYNFHVYAAQWKQLPASYPAIMQPQPEPNQTDVARLYNRAWQFIGLAGSTAGLALVVLHWATPLALVVALGLLCVCMAYLACAIWRSLQSAHINRTYHIKPFAWLPAAVGILLLPITFAATLLLGVLGFGK